MDNLERRVEVLERLPERITSLESQIVLLRNEIRSEFSALRQEVRAGDEALAQRMDALFDSNERHMRLLHEDLVERIARIGEGR